jgi:hypothetical protein
MTEATDTNPGTTMFETKFTAARIEENCPVMLQDLGKRIAVHSEKAQKCKDKADQHYNTIAQLLATAHRACEEGGFAAFREMFFPKLGKSRVYELLAIGTSKKSVEDTKAGTRARVTKHRANKAVAPPSVTVTENSEQEAVAQGAPKEDGEIEAPSIASEQMPGPKNPWSATASDEALRVFAAHLLGLYKGTNKRPPEHFSATTTSVEIIAQVASFLTDLAGLKKSDAAEPAQITALLNDDNVSVGQSDENMKAERPAQDAEEVPR